MVQKRNRTVDDSLGTLAENMTLEETNRAHCYTNGHYIDSSVRQINGYGK